MADELRRENRFESSRIALAAPLGLESDLQVVAEVGRGDEVLDVVARTNPDVALLDVEMPGADGIAVAAELHAKHPAVRILVVTTFGRPGYLRRAIDAGRAGSWSRTLPAVRWPMPSGGFTWVRGWWTRRVPEGTVRNHLSAAIGKTSTSTRAEAVRAAERMGWQ